MDIVEECLRRIVAVESAEDFLWVEEVVRGKGGRFGVEGVVGVSIGACWWSCIFNTAFVFSYTDECSGDLIRPFASSGLFRTGVRGERG